MKKTQGSNPINDSTSPPLESFQSTPAILQTKFPKLIEEKFHIDGNTLAKSILFSCHKCDGPLVPSLQCPVCNKTSFRKCTKCKNEIPCGSHQACEVLLLMGALESGKSKKEMLK